jgi:hypothetical protein
MWQKRKNRRWLVHFGTLACLLLLATAYALAADKPPGKTGQASNGKKIQQGQTKAPPTTAPSTTTFVPSEKISAGKSVFFPNDI